MSRAINIHYEKRLLDSAKKYFGETPIEQIREEWELYKKDTSLPTPRIPTLENFIFNQVNNSMKDT